MTTNTIINYLKYANLQMAAEAINLPLVLSGSQSFSTALTTGNNRASVFPTSLAQDFSSQYIVVAHQANTATGFSGTLFKYTGPTDTSKGLANGELTLSIRSTEFIDDDVRDTQATNKMEISQYGFAFGQISDMENWYAQLNQAGGPLAGQNFAVTGYSLGGHLATAFALLRNEQGQNNRITGTYTFNGAGVGTLNAQVTPTLSALIQQFNLQRKNTSGSAIVFSTPAANTLYSQLRTLFNGTHNYNELLTLLNQAVAQINSSEGATVTTVNVGTAPNISTTLTAASSDAMFMINAINRIAQIMSEGQRMSGIIDPNGNPLQIPGTQVEATKIDYQVAVLNAQQGTAAGPTVFNGANLTALSRPQNPFTLPNFYDIYGDSKYSAVSNSQYHYGKVTPVAIEDQPDARGNVIVNAALNTALYQDTKLLGSNFSNNDFGDTHSLALLVDSLEVQSLYAQLDPNLSLATAKGIFQSVTNTKASSSIATQGKAEGDALEKMLNGLADLLRVSKDPSWKKLSDTLLTGNLEGNTWWKTDDQGFYTGRNALYNDINLIKNSSVFQALQGKVKVEALAGIDVYILAGRARSDFGALVTLMNLSPIRLIGTDSTNQGILNNYWQQLYPTEYAKWNYDQTHHVNDWVGANFSNEWLYNRAKMLAWQIDFNKRDVPYDATQLRKTLAPYKVSDIALGETLRVTNISTDVALSNAQFDQNKETSIFGSDQNETLNGGLGQDWLFGGGGNDLLLSRNLDGQGNFIDDHKNDYLEGGDGNDTLTGGGGDTLVGGNGFDTYKIDSSGEQIVDSDGQGQIVLNGVLLTGAPAGGNFYDYQGYYHIWLEWHVSEPNFTRYALAFNSQGGYDLSISDYISSVVVNDFYNGKLGIYLGNFPTDPTNSDFHQASSFIENASTSLYATEGDDALGWGHYNDPESFSDILQSSLVATPDFQNRGYIFNSLGGDDLIEGTPRPDIITGGTGNDTMVDTWSDDVFVFNSGDGNDYIGLGWDGGFDTLRIHGISSSQATFKQTGYAEVEMRFSSNDSITFKQSIDQIVFDGGTVWKTDHAFWQKTSYFPSSTWASFTGNNPTTGEIVLGNTDDTVLIRPDNLILGPQQVAGFGISTDINGQVIKITDTGGNDSYRFDNSAYSPDDSHLGILPIRVQINDQQGTDSLDLSAYGYGAATIQPDQFYFHQFGLSANTTYRVEIKNAFGEFDGNNYVDIVSDSQGNNPIEQIKIGNVTQNWNQWLSTNYVSTSQNIDQQANEDALFNYAFPVDKFSNLSGQINLTAILQNGAALPTWLTFNQSTAVFSGTPSNHDVGVAAVRVKAVDALGRNGWIDFSLKVNNTNDIPVVQNPLPDQTINLNQPFNLIIPANIFKDVDVGDSLGLIARLAGGQALPSWLSFNAATHTLSGTPGSANAGTLNIEVLASDQSGASASDMFALNVGAVANHAPVVANLIADQAINEDAPFSFTVPANSFTDVDVGDTLTYSAALSNGNPLPTWLAFNAVTQTFSGTPANAQVGAIDIRVTATDSVNAAVSDIFRVTINNTNDAPVVTTLLPDQSTNEDAPFSFTVPANSFIDADMGDTLIFSAALSDGSPLPSWLSFNAATKIFSGTPANAQVGTIDIRVTATDTSNVSVSDVFRVTINNTNDAPIIVTPITDTTAVRAQVFSWILPANTFADVDVGDTLTYSVAMMDGSALPSWLTFNAATRTLNGTVPSTAAGPLNFRVTATDSSNTTVSDDFLVNLSAANPIIMGTSGNDFLNGTAANDVMEGGAGNDILNGLDGNDIFLVNGTDGYTDTFNGGAGFDTILGGTGNDIIAVSVLNAANSIERIDGGAGVNRISGGNGNDTIDLTGIEVLNIAKIAGGSGNDTIIGSSGADVIDGSGDGYGDVLNGAGGDDTFLVNGNDGSADTYIGGTGFDTILGGSGNDTIVVGTLTSANSIERIDGGAGSNILMGSWTQDTIDLTGIEVLNIAKIVGGGGNDTITGTNGADVIDGSGDGYGDVLNGAGGDDTFLVNGDDGSADIYNGGSGFDIILGSAGNDTIRATNITSIERIDGGAGNDIIIGSSSADTINGGAGNDTLTGGTGNDIYQFTRGDGADTIVENDTTVGNSDLLKFMSGIADDQLWFQHTGNDLVVSVIGTTDKTTISNWYLGSQYQVETIQTVDGNHALIAAKVDLLVQAMASFSPPTAGQTTLPASYQTALNPVIAANWS